MNEKNIVKSIREIDPIFSFKVKGGGDIYVYVFDSEVARFAIITYDDTSTEVAYAVETLQGANKVEAELLVKKAIHEWGETPNPFKQLLRNKKEIKRLADCFYARIMLW